MTDVTDHDDRSGPDGAADAPMRLGLIRLGIGLVQGLALYGLHKAEDGAGWPNIDSQVFGPLILIAAFIPILLLAGVGRMRTRTLLAWTAAATAALAFLGWYDVTQQLPGQGTLPFPTPLLMAVSAAGLFIAHHLIAPADRARRLFAPYPDYFDMTWKAGVQLALSLGFVGVFWIILFLGSSLFRVIGLTFLEDLIRQDWFWIPVTCVVFALAVHLTDVRDGLIRGVRTVALMLLSWLLPVMTVLAFGFLAALPFTGLDGLWETGSATALVLAATGALILLINAAYQDGTPENLPPLVLRWAVRIAAVLLVPLVGIAIWGLALRIGQHGLTPDRIIAVACTAVGAIHAAGYALSPLRPGDWMQPLERTNITAAVLMVAVVLALFTPLADPQRLSVDNQMSRLESGAVSAEEFDYAFLKFEAGRHGQAALARLTRSDNPEIARRAREAEALDNRWNARRMDPEAAPPVIEAYPEDAVLPPAFTGASRHDLSGCTDRLPCVATLRDLDDDGVEEMLLAHAAGGMLRVFARTDTDWVQVGVYALVLPCGESANGDAPAEAMRAGRLSPAPARWPDLMFGDRRAAFQPSRECDAVLPAATAEPPEPPAP